MTRSVHIALAAAVWFGIELNAQQPAHSRTSADQLLKGHRAAGSFAELQQFLDSGYEIVVTDEEGKTRRGRVASISGDDLVVASPVSAGQWEALLPLYWPADVGVVLKRRFFRSQERRFSAASVRRIDIVDPAGRGTAIGAAVGAGLVAGAYLWERQQPASNLKGLVTTLAIVWGVPVSLRMGHIIDRATNEPVYERQPRTRLVTVSPWVGPHVAGVVTQVRF